jgi:putative transposase
MARLAKIEELWGRLEAVHSISAFPRRLKAEPAHEGEHLYLHPDGIVMKRTWVGEVRNASLLVASAVNSEGFREILGICDGAKEDKPGWSAFLRHLVDRGLTGVRLIISDACRGLLERTSISRRSGPTTHSSESCERSDAELFAKVGDGMKG